MHKCESPNNGGICNITCNSYRDESNKEYLKLKIEFPSRYGGTCGTSEPIIHCPFCGYSPISGKNAVPDTTNLLPKQFDITETIADGTIENVMSLLQQLKLNGYTGFYFDGYNATIYAT